MKKTTLWRVGDLIPILLCLLVAGAWLLSFTVQPCGETLVVQTPDGVQTFSLQENGITAIVGNDGIALTVRIRDGSACVAESACPDQVCVHTGLLTRAGQTAACLPAGIVLRIEGPAPDDTPDAVVR